MNAVAAPSVLRALLSRDAPIVLEYSGHAFPFALPHGATFRVLASDALQPRDLVLLDCDGASDVRRVLSMGPDSALETTLDAIPHSREHVPLTQVLGVIEPVAPHNDFSRFGRRLPQSVIAAASQLLALWRGASPGDMSDHCAARKAVSSTYKEQVPSYSNRGLLPLSPFLRDAASEIGNPAATILLAGCGTGPEALQLSRLGFRVLAFDLVEEMLASARRRAEYENSRVSFLLADATTLPLSGRDFDLVIFTERMYSMIPRREARVAALEQAAAVLRDGGRILLSVALLNRPRHLIRALVFWLRGLVSSAEPPEFGDTTVLSLSPTGMLSASYRRRFFLWQLLREFQDAGVSIHSRADETHFILAPSRSYRA